MHCYNIYIYNIIFPCRIQLINTADSVKSDLQVGLLCYCMYYIILKLWTFSIKITNSYLMYSKYFSLFIFFKNCFYFFSVFA